jgi:hypothetical protein
LGFHAPITRHHLQIRVSAGLASRPATWLVTMWQVLHATHHLPRQVVKTGYMSLAAHVPVISHLMMAPWLGPKPVVIAKLFALVNSRLLVARSCKNLRRVANDHGSQHFALGGRYAEVSGVVLHHPHYTHTQEKIDNSDSKDDRRPRRGRAPASRPGSPTTDCGGGGRWLGIHAPTTRHHLLIRVSAGLASQPATWLVTMWQVKHDAQPTIALGRW